MQFAQVEKHLDKTGKKHILITHIVAANFRP